MSFWNKILRNKEKNKTEALTGLYSDVKKSIDIIGNAGSIADDKLLALLIYNEIEENRAIEIITFLPIVFVRKWLIDVNWSKTYLEYYSETKRVSKRFSDNQHYKIMEKIVEHYWYDKPVNDVIVNIAVRSAEFSAVNKLLHDGKKMTDIKMTETIIIRTE